MEKLISKIKFYLLLILVVLIGISYHPYFFMDEEVDIRSGISIYIIGLTLLVTALSVKVKVFSNKIILNYFVYLLFFICITLVLVSLNYSMPFDEIKKISIPLASIIIGYNLSLKSRYYIILIVFFTTSVFLSAYYQIKENIGGFIIAEQYLADEKNGLGGLLSLAGISLMILTKNVKQNWQKLIIIIFVIFTLIILLTIRARSATLAYTFVVFVFFIKNKLNSKVKKTNSILAIVATFVLISFLLINLGGKDSPSSALFDYVYNSFTLNQKDIGSGRMDRNLDGLNIFLNNPVLGNLQENEELESVHNYPLRILSEYGLIGGWPLLCIYFMIGAFSIIKIHNSKRIRLVDLGLFLIISQYIISLAEPAFPFGPGSISFFAFMMFGITLKENDSLINSNQNFELK